MKRLRKNYPNRPIDWLYLKPYLAAYYGLYYTCQEDLWDEICHQVSTDDQGQNPQVIIIRILKNEVIKSI